MTLLTLQFIISCFIVLNILPEHTWMAFAECETSTPLWRIGNILSHLKTIISQSVSHWLWGMALIFYYITDGLGLQVPTTTTQRSILLKLSVTKVTNDSMTTRLKTYIAVLSLNDVTVKRKDNLHNQT